MKINQQEPIYNAASLGKGKMAILGLQHLFAMFGATILVPILVNNYFHGEGLSVQVTLFFAGVGTLLFHVLSKFKVQSKTLAPNFAAETEASHPACPAPTTITSYLNISPLYSKHKSLFILILVL